MIRQIKKPDGSLATSNLDIASCFEQYSHNLYNLPHSKLHQNSKELSTTIFRDFLKQYAPKPIPQDIALSFESPISGEELSQVIKQMKIGTSPGPDSFTAVYYKTFQNTLNTPLLAAFNSITSTTPPHCLLEAHITVLPKEGKDLQLPPNLSP